LGAVLVVDVEGWRARSVREEAKEIRVEGEDIGRKTMFT
jgi:hypothetical protein